MEKCCWSSEVVCEHFVHQTLVLTHPWMGYPVHVQAIKVPESESVICKRWIKAPRLKIPATRWRRGEGLLVIGGRNLVTLGLICFENWTPDAIKAKSRKTPFQPPFEALRNGQAGLLLFEHLGKFTVRSQCVPVVSILCQARKQKSYDPS